MTRARDGQRRPRLGFVGVGWIGRHRMQAIVESGHAEVAALSDPTPAALEAARTVAPAAAVCATLDEVLERGVDGVVIATPSALHAEQAMRALRAGAAVFCQKPLARSAEETRRVLDAAQAADRLLGVDLSYRFTAGVQRLRELVQGGALGEVFGINLVFHNAYGPDKPWFYDPVLSGGGCTMDLGIHLVDLMLWITGFPGVVSVASALRVGGRPVRAGEVEDFATAQLELENGASVQLACSWKLPAGRDCVIEASFYGTRGGATFRNVGGSFYDFVAERFWGTRTEELARPPDAWGGRAAVAWAERIARSPGFDPEVRGLLHTAEALDRIYAASPALPLAEAMEKG